MILDLASPESKEIFRSITLEDKEEISAGAYAVGLESIKQRGRYIGVRNHLPVLGHLLLRGARKEELERLDDLYLIHGKLAVELNSQLNTEASWLDGEAPDPESTPRVTLDATHRPDLFANSLYSYTRGQTDFTLGNPWPPYDLTATPRPSPDPRHQMIIKLATQITNLLSIGEEDRFSPVQVKKTLEEELDMLIDKPNDPPENNQ